VVWSNFFISIPFRFPCWIRFGFIKIVKGAATPLGGRAQRSPASLGRAPAGGARLNASADNKGPESGPPS
jgi:hypothetical protein